MLGLIELLSYVKEYKLVMFKVNEVIWISIMFKLSKINMAWSPCILHLYFP
jgi:hypothetical protein